MKIKHLITTLLLSFAGLSAIAQDTPSPSADTLTARMEKKSKEVEDRYKGRIAAIQKQGQEVADDMKQPVKFDVTVRWNNRKMSLDLPQVTMENKDIKFDVPQVEMKMDSIIFHTPSTRMKRVKVGQTPHVHGWTIKWRDNFIDVPEIFMQRQEIKTKIPQFKMETTRIVLKIPEVKMDRTNFMMKVPEFYVDQINLLIPISQGGNKEKIERIKDDSEKLALEMNAEMIKEIANVQDEAAKAAAIIAAASDQTNETAITEGANKSTNTFKKSTKDVTQFVTEHGKKLDAETLKKYTDSLSTMEAAQQAGNEKLLSAVEDLKKVRDTGNQTIQSAKNEAPQPSDPSS
jgi:hypothetical protein